MARTSSSIVRRRAVWVLAVGVLAGLALVAPGPALMLGPAWLLLVAAVLQPGEAALVALASRRRRKARRPVTPCPRPQPRPLLHAPSRRFATPALAMRPPPPALAFP